jgi:hypothetical protein
MSIDQSGQTEMLSYLRQICPIECRILGRSVVEDISRGRPESEFVHGEGAAMIDFDTVLKVVIAVANLLTAIFALRSHLLKDREHGSSDRDIAKHAQAERKRLEIDFSVVPRDKRQAAFRIVLRDMDDHDGE